MRTLRQRARGKALPSPPRPPPSGGGERHGLADGGPGGIGSAQAAKRPSTGRAPRSQTDRARGSWQLPEKRLAEADLEQQQPEGGPQQPGVRLAVVEELRRLERRLLCLVDLVVHVTQRLRVGRPEVL